MLNYIRFLLKSTNKHGVHSPFVFNLVTKCFNKKTNSQKKQTFLKAKREVLKKSSNSQFSNKKAYILIRLLNYFNPKRILVSSIKDIEKIAIQIGNERDAISHLNELKNIKKYDFIYLGRSQNEILNDFETCLEHIHNDSILLISDIHSSKKIQSTWKTIKEHSKVTVTIDTFHFGLVFFRTEQEKEHFTIRV